MALIYASGYSPEAIEKLFAAVDQKGLYGRDAEDGPSMLGLSGVRACIERSRLPLYGLGGINADNITSLMGSGLSGIGAIEAFQID